MSHHLSTTHSDVIKVGSFSIANVYKPPSEAWTESNPLPSLPHPAIYVGDFNSHHNDWGYNSSDVAGEVLSQWASCCDLTLIHDPKQKGTFRSARWQKDYSPDLCWVSSVHGSPQPATCSVLDDFPHSQHRPSIIHVGLTLPVVHCSNKKRWNFRKANWAKFTQDTERSIPTIPRHTIPVDEAYTRFTGALSKAAHASIPRGVRRLYIPCMDEEAATLLKEYEESGDPDIADHLMESLNAARRARWEESTTQLNFTRSSRKSWALIRRLGAAQRPPKSAHPPVTANAVASHLVQVAKAPKERRHERNVRDGWRQYLRSQSISNPPKAFSIEEVTSSIKHVKLGTAPGYDNVHPEFLKHLGPKGLAWLAHFFTRVTHESRIPKIWRQAKVIALEKPGKDPHLAASYRPISLLSVCYKLLERVVLQRISPQVEQLLSPDQAGFRRGRCTSEQVAALTTHIENGFQNNLKTGTVFLDLTAAYDTIWHTGLLFKLSKVMDGWFVVLVRVLLQNRRFRVHIGDDVSSWRHQSNGLPQGSVLAPTLFNLYTNDLPVMLCRRFIYADDICCAVQAKTFAELECILTSDVARLAEYCRHWRLKPSTSKTVTSVFHLHNASSHRELAVTMNGQKLRHDQNPVYLGVTLDRTLSYKEHLTKVAAKLKSRNNLLSKLAGTSWGAQADTLHTSALALCYSVAEYCCPSWSRSSHTRLVDTQLNSTMRLISGTLRPTQLHWLPVLANISPLDLRRKAAVDNLVVKIEAHPEWPVHADVFDHPPQRLPSRKPIWVNMVPDDTNERWREEWESAPVVNKTLVSDPTIRQPGFNLPRRSWSTLNRFRTGQGLCAANLHRWHLIDSDKCQCGQPQTMLHIVESCPLTQLSDGGLQRLHSADDIAVTWLDNIATTAFAK